MLKKIISLFLTGLMITGVVAHDDIQNSKILTILDQLAEYGITADEIPEEILEQII